MKVKVTAKMAQEIKKELKKHTTTKDCGVYLCELDEQKFTYYNGSIFNHLEDYNGSTGKFKCIMIEYPEDYYAAPKSLTSEDLQDIARARVENGILTLEDFMQGVFEEVEI